MINWSSSKLKLCFIKDPVERIKKEAIHWEKILANHISDEVLVSRIYKEASNLNSEKN